MAQNNVVSKISGIVNEAPIAEILSVAESVSSFVPIPGLPIVIKVLRIALKMQPEATKTLGIVGSTVDKCQQSKIDEVEQMMAIAIEDGEISAEEEEVFLNKVRRAGLDEDEWKMKLYSRAEKVKNRRGQVDAKELQSLNDMIQDIVEDGEITLVEEEIFFNKVRKLGLDEDEWRLRLYNDAAKVRKRLENQSMISNFQRSSAPSSSNTVSYETNQYKVMVNGQQHGPYSYAQMCGFINQGRMNRNTKVIRKGDSNWKTASDYRELLEVLKSAGY